MQIVIEIPKYVIDDMKECGFIPEEDNEELCKAIDNGTVLPKHGRLIDVDNIQEIQLEDSLTVLTHKKGDEVGWYIDAPTILEANK